MERGNLMEKILIVSSIKGYLSVAVHEKLCELEYEVIDVNYDVDELNGMKEDIAAYIVYIDEQMISDKSGLAFIKDSVAMNNTDLFLIGDEDELKMAGEMIPDVIVSHKFERPINVKDVTQIVDKTIKSNIKRTKKTILVVDDSGAMLWNVKGWLEDKYQVILANSCAMAIKYLALNKPDLILLDYEMPIVDGRQVLEMIRAESDFADIPVIFLTSKSDRESVLKVMSLKPEGYLLKTMEPKEIIDKIDDFFEKLREKEILSKL